MAVAQRTTWVGGVPPRAWRRPAQNPSLFIYGLSWLWRGVRAGLVCAPDQRFRDAVHCFNFSDELSGRALEFKRGLTVRVDGRISFEQMKDSAQDTDC